MSIQVTTATCTVGEFFSDGKVYELPPFQRSYSWTEDQAYQLFDDLHNACIDSNGNNGTEYFLGAIILVNGDQFQPCSIVDGQQRLVTLTAILAVLRDNLPQGGFRRRLQERIERSADEALGFETAPRIHVRLNDQEAFQRYVVNDGGTEAVSQGAETPSMTKLVNVLRRLKSEFPYAADVFFQKLVTFILNRCSFVVIKTTSLDTAYKLFKSVNNRGTPLDELALARAELVGPVLTQPRVSWTLTQAWDELADRLTEKELREYVRSIAQTVSPNEKNIELYLLIRKISLDRILADRFQKNLAYFVINYSRLKSATIDFGQDSEVINRHVHCLLGYEIQEWRSVALIWLSEVRTNRQHYEFFRYLDGLLLGLTILYGKNSRVVAKRFADLISAIGEGAVLEGATSPIFLSAEEKLKIRQRIQIPQRSFAKPLLLRLNAQATTI